MTRKFNFISAYTLVVNIYSKEDCLVLSNFGKFFKDVMEVRSMSSLYAAYICAQIVGLLAIILSVYWVFAYNDGLGFSEKALFNWHPIFLTIGMVFLLGNGIMIFRMYHDSPKKSLKFVHFGLNALGLVCTLLGAVAVIAFKYETRQLQFFSLHSWVGFIGVVIYLMQALISISVFFFNCVSSRGKTAFLSFHVFLGQLIFFLGIMSIISGYNEGALLFLIPDYSKVIAWSGLVANFIGVLCAVYGVLVVYIISTPIFKHQLLPEDTALLGEN